jgi:hypothetical protein
LLGFGLFAAVFLLLCNKIPGQLKTTLIWIADRWIPLKEGLMNSFLQSPFGMPGSAAFAVARIAGGFTA